MNAHWKKESFFEKTIFLVILIITVNFSFLAAQTQTPPPPNPNTISPGQITRDTIHANSNTPASSNTPHPNSLQLKITPVTPNATNPNQTSPTIPNPNLNEPNPPSQDSIIPKRTGFLPKYHK